MVTAFLLAGCATALNSTRQELLTSPGRHALPANVAAPDVKGALLLDVRLDRQVSGNACGAHAAASLLDYWFRTMPSARAEPPTGVDIYREGPPAHSDGYSLAQMVEVLEARGLSALGVRTARAALRSELEQGRPAIARVSLEPSELLSKTVWPPETPLIGRLGHWLSTLTLAMVNGLHPRTVDHYWVVAGYTPTHMLVVDPMMGMRQVEVTHFDRVFQRGGQLALVSGGWHAAERTGTPAAPP